MKRALIQGMMGHEPTSLITLWQPSPGPDPTPAEERVSKEDQTRKEETGRTSAVSVNLQASMGGVWVVALDHHTYHTYMKCTAKLLKLRGSIRTLHSGPHWLKEKQPTSNSYREM